MPFWHYGTQEAKVSAWRGGTQEVQCAMHPGPKQVCAVEVPGHLPLQLGAQGMPPADSQPKVPSVRHLLVQQPCQHRINVSGVLTAAEL